MSRHAITLTVTVTLDIEDEVIARALTAEWQGNFYQMDRVDDVFEMLAWNIGCREIGLSRLDGWADMPDSAAVVVDLDCVIDDVEAIS